jgi:hypothetical protein
LQSFGAKVSFYGDIYVFCAEWVQEYYQKETVFTPLFDASFTGKKLVFKKSG